MVVVQLPPVPHKPDSPNPPIQIPVNGPCIPTGVLSYTINFNPLPGIDVYTWNYAPTGSGAGYWGGTIYPSKYAFGVIKFHTSQSIVERKKLVYHGVLEEIWDFIFGKPYQAITEYYYQQWVTKAYWTEIWRGVDTCGNYTDIYVPRSQELIYYGNVTVVPTDPGTLFPETGNNQGQPSTGPQPQPDPNPTGGGDNTTSPIQQPLNGIWTEHSENVWRWFVPEDSISYPNKLPNADILSSWSAQHQRDTHWLHEWWDNHASQIHNGTMVIKDYPIWPGRRETVDIMEYTNPTYGWNCVTCGTAGKAQIEVATIVYELFEQK
jgi:hypothetical protein